jgi:hypothetical protein
MLDPNMINIFSELNIWVVHHVVLKLPHLDFQFHTPVRFLFILNHYLLLEIFKVYFVILIIYEVLTVCTWIWLRLRIIGFLKIEHTLFFSTETENTLLRFFRIFSALNISLLTSLLQIELLNFVYSFYSSLNTISFIIKFPLLLLQGYSLW